MFLGSPKDSGREDWGTVGKIRGITTPPLRVLFKKKRKVGYEITLKLTASLPPDFLNATGSDDIYDSFLFGGAKVLFCRVALAN